VQIVEIISRIGVDGARFIEEHIDPQFQALRHLYGSGIDSDAFVRLVVANALVSYQLSGKGEEWWWEFARGFSNKNVSSITKAYARFLPNSRTNRRLTPTKLKRLERVEPFLKSMDVEQYYRNMRALQEDLSDALGTSKNAKTVVFAVKMFGYAARIVMGKFRPYPMDIPIPVDSRIRRLTVRLGEKDPIRFWQGVAEETEVPPLHIDSILWPAMSGNPEVQEKIRGAFGDVGEELIRFVGK